MRKIILITGGQRSGKSRYAEELALSLSTHPVYVATAHVWDEEFHQRVLKHQQRRGPQWTNIEEERLLSRHDVTNRVVVIDCITLWCTNYFYDSSLSGTALPDVEEALAAIKEEFNRFTQQEATFIFVTNEIGCGGVSTDAIQRRFTDLQGWMNQYVASKADEVVWMVSGIPVEIKHLFKKE
jgi:adenosylcobinamide kinase/adenosylcobinamide-phosphate guanylyltransferase